MFVMDRWLRAPLLFAFLVVLLFGYAHATIVIANAKDWRFAYILGYYAPMKNYGFLAIDSRANGEEVIPYLIHNKSEQIIVYESDNPVIPNYEGLLRAKGFTNVRTVRVHDPYTFMFDLPRDWGIHPKGYVLVSDSAGEWVLSAGPLAYEKGDEILFINNRTIDRIISAVPKTASIYVIGYQGRRLHKAFPNAVFISTGSKAKDSIEIAKEFNKDVQFSQVYVLSGMFLYLPALPDDPPVWTGAKGKYPVIITYTSGMPDYVEKFLSSPQIKAIVFIGPELDKQWSELREKFKGTKRVTELFAVGYRNVPTREPGKPYPQPAFLLPTAEVKITPESVDALAVGKIFIRLRNVGKAAGYARITYIRIKCGDETMEIMPKNAIFVDAGDSVLAEYNVGKVLPQTNCSVYLEGLYGPDADRSTGDFNATFSVYPQSFNDPSKVDVLLVKYSPRLERFIIYVKNTGPVRTYVTAYLKDVLIDGVPHTIKSRQVALAPGETERIYAKAYLTDADFLDNPEVTVVLRYGEQPNLPVKILVKKLKLEKETFTDIVIEFIQENPILVGAVVLFIIFILFVLLRRR